jgi:predicted nuclease with TOPRIM domain|tara:strand:+ start:21740 stop:22375 length:636 start_codon:yes stop_codon:yes gene_type:complete
MSKFDNISKLLPEGLTEDTVSEIATLVGEVITEEVENKVKDLENKVHGFLRMKIDEVKSHALAELEQENDTFKNARIFESLKALMALELNSDDEDTAIGQTRKEFDEVQEENDVLVRELNSALTECSKLENTLRVLSEKNEILEDERFDLQEAVVSLEESAKLPFESNEKAVIISDDVDSEVTDNDNNTVETQSRNEFINEDMMAFMPFKK